VAPPWVSRIVHEAERRLGVAVVERDELASLRENTINFQMFKEEASELGYHALGYFSGRPHELRAETRVRLSQRSRLALMQDPTAGAEADLKANFAFGRGITAPDAIDEKVQEILQEAWEDPINQSKLTGFEAQRHRSYELISQANLYPTAYVKNGRVRLGFLDADTVRSIVPDPDDEERPLYYATAKRRFEWDFINDRAKTTDEMRGETGQPKVVYYPHWQNVEDMKADAAEDGETPPAPPAGKLGDGLVYHVRINRIGRSQFGTPPWARTLRFFRALSDLTEAHVVMAQAASTFVAKQTMKGSPEQLTKAANSVLSQTGELGAARFGETPNSQQFPRQEAPPPGSFWLENESNKLEALSLNSGSGQVAQTAQIVRAPIAASSGFGQHYLGDAGNANLATATSLELPTLMAVRAWQQTFKEMLQWFCDLVIQEAVRAGRLGGRGEALTVTEAQSRGIPSYVGQKPLDELRLRETVERKEMERRTGKELSYTITLPYPGRRNLPDVVTMVGTIVTVYDPQGVNVPLRRGLLTFLATHGMELENPQAWVDEVLPDDLPAEPVPGATPQPPPIDSQAATVMPGIDPATGAPYPDPRNPDVAAASAEQQMQLAQKYPPPGRAPDGTSRGERPKGARTGAPPKTREELALMATERRLLSEALGMEVAQLWEDAWWSEPELTGANGNGSGH
jgi:hypothetical protein